MDLANIKPASEMIHEMLHPGTDEPLGIKVSLCSLDDEKMKRIKRKITDDQQILKRRGKDFTAAQIEENTNLICFTAMNGWVWEGEASFHGEKPVFNQANVYRVFNELSWFREQISEAIGETKSFFIS